MMRRPIGGGIQRMDAAGTDQDNVPFPQDISLIVALYGINAFYRHDDLHGCVPVGRIIFIFLIIVQLERGALLIINGFKNAVQGFDHQSVLLLPQIQFLPNNIPKMNLRTYKNCSQNMKNCQ